MSGIYSNYRGVADANRGYDHLNSLHSLAKDFIGFGRDVAEEVESDEQKVSNVFVDKIWPRLKAFGLLLAGPVTQVADTTGGVLLGTVTIFSGKWTPELNRRADHLINSGNNLLSEAFAGVVRIIDPNAEGLKGDYAPEDWKQSSKIAKALFEKAEKWAENPQKNFFVRELASRVCFLVSGVLFVIARVVDTIFGLFLAARAIYNKGQDSRLNQHAYVNLKLPAVLGDIVICLRKTVCPTATPVTDRYSPSRQVASRDSTLSSRSSEGAQRTFQGEQQYQQV